MLTAMAPEVPLSRKKRSNEMWSVTGRGCRSLTGTRTVVTSTKPTQHESNDTQNIVS